MYRVDKHEANQLVWVDRSGQEVDTLAGDVETGYFWPSLSPDGRRLSVSQYAPGATGGQDGEEAADEDGAEKAAEAAPAAESNESTESAEA